VGGTALKAFLFPSFYNLCHGAEAGVAAQQMVNPMPTNYLAVAGVSVIALSFSLYQLRQSLFYRNLRRHGVTAAATVLTAKQIEQKNTPVIRLDVSYLDEAQKQHQARLIAPESQGRFNEYQAGDEVLIRYHPQQTSRCELAEVLDVPWWSGPLVPAVFLGAVGSYFLMDAISHLLQP
jgi:hypothetical protein